MTFPVKFTDRLRQLNKKTTANAVKSQAIAWLTDLVPALAEPVFGTLADRKVDLVALVQDDEALAEHIRQNVAGMFHVAGTCRMGAATDREAVVDTRRPRARLRRSARGRRLDHADGAARQHQHPDHHAGREDFGGDERMTEIPTADELIARARALAPKLRERAVKAERDRNIPHESVEEYIAAGLIHTLQPKRWGGYEHDHEVMFDIAVELGKSTCGSSAWCLNYLGDHAAILAHFPEEAQHDVWSRDKAACIATSAAPTGKVTVAPGGYKLNGRWSWCSGLRHSQWIMIGGLVFREGEDHPDMRLYLVPVSQVKQDDTWYCAGLSATGSNTSVLDDVFVPEHRSVSFATLRDACSPGLQDQHQSDLPHAVHRRAHLRAARRRRSALPAAAMPISCNGPSSAI